MTPHRRKAVSLAVLAPTVLIAIGYGFEWGYLLPLVGVVGGLVMISVSWLVFYAVLPGVHAERGLPAVFVLGWGAAVLAAAAGAAAAAVTGNELTRYDRLSAFPQADDMSVYHWEQSPAASQHLVQVLKAENPTPGITGMTSVHSVVPDGTAAGALLTGWLAGGAGAVAYARTRPSAAAAGAGVEPIGDADPGGRPGDADAGRDEQPQPPPVSERPEGAESGADVADGRSADTPDRPDGTDAPDDRGDPEAPDDPDRPGGPGGA